MAPIRGWLATLLTVVAISAEAADPWKVLRVALGRGPPDFDPQVAGDAYSHRISRAIFDGARSRPCLP